MSRIILLLLLCATLASTAQAGPVLDDLLNYAVVDQSCPAERVKEEGMGLTSRGNAKFIALSKGSPRGQTFRLGPKANRLWRVTTGICHWPGVWDEGEAVTFTLWDSPVKKNRLYTRTIDFSHKWFKWDIAYDIDIATKHEAGYYFELTHNGGGDGKINIAYIPNDEYKRGQAYVAGKPDKSFDLYFVAISKPKGDRKANLKRFLSQFDYTYPPLKAAGEAYRKGNYDRACALVLKQFQTRTKPDSLTPKPVPADQYNSTEADQVCNEGRLYDDPKKKGAWIEMSRATTWREVWPNTADYVRMNDLFQTLGRAYQTTKNEKYAKKLNELMADYIQDNPTPFEGGMRGGKWVAMFAAWRTGDAWGGFGSACKSRGLTDDVKLAWLDYWFRMAKFAELEPSGGNHANAVGQALMQFGYRFPEFSRSKHWRQWGFEKLVSNSMELFYDDGACSEPTMNYHGYSLANLMLGIEMAKKYDVEVPKDTLKLVEKALAYTGYMMMPNAHVPSLGDTNCQDFRASERPWERWITGEPMDAYKLFGREDCRFIATMGKEGKRPESTSYYFPDIRHFIMRSDWGGENGRDYEQARWLFLRGGSYGSHGHWDMNQITLYAYGRPLIIDPGRTRYDSPLMPELIKNTSHNVLLVGDQKMQHVDPTLHSWQASPVLDFVDNSYTDLYKDVDHRRAVIFVRPDYYVMFDHALSKDPHKYGINFWLTPPDAVIDKESCSVHSSEPNGANVLIQVMNKDGVEITERKGKLDLADKIWDNIPVVTFHRKDQAEAAFATVLYPYPTGSPCPGLKTQWTRTGDAQACSVATPSGTDYVFYAPEPARAEIPATCAIDGRTGLVRTDNNGAVTSFALVNGTAIYLGRQPLATCDKPVEVLSVKYLPDTIEVTCPKAESSLEIASMGKTKAIVNGKEMKVSGEKFRIGEFLTAD